VFNDNTLNFTFEVRFVRIYLNSVFPVFAAVVWKKFIYFEVSLNKSAFSRMPNMKNPRTHFHPLLKENQRLWWIYFGISMEKRLWNLNYVIMRREYYFRIHALTIKTLLICKMQTMFDQLRSLETTDIHERTCKIPFAVLHDINKNGNWTNLSNHSN
jgi:hypothetical protein